MKDTKFYHFCKEYKNILLAAWKHLKVPETLRFIETLRFS